MKNNKNPNDVIIRKRLAAIGFLLLLDFLFCPGLSASPLTASEMRGKQIYLTGNSPSGKTAKALVGLGSVELPAVQVPCASCHGEDGHGRPEGGIVPTDITYEYLTLAYGHNHDNGRKHGAFTPQSIVTALMGGIDPSGNRLDSAMPRYVLSDQDNDDLIAYLKRLSTDVDPVRNQATFYLLPGLKNEARAMVDYVVDVLHLKDASPMVISLTYNNILGVAEVVGKQSQTRGLGFVTQFAYPQRHDQAGSFIAQLKKQHPEVIFFFGAQDELVTLLKNVEVMKPRPYVFISGSLTGFNGFDKTFRDKIFLSFPSLSFSQARSDEFSRLVTQNRLKAQHPIAQAAAYSAAKLLVAGLQQTGRELSRKKLIKTLETFYQFDTGLMPFLSYGANRHIGSTEVSIISAPRRDYFFIPPKR